MEMQNIDIKSNNNYSKFNYKKLLIHKTQKKYTHHFNLITFNNNSTIIFIGGGLVGIKIIGFNNKQKEIQILINVEVSSLFFVKKFNQLLSMQDNTIIIWNQDKNNFWSPYQVLLDSEAIMSCGIMDKEENIVITGNVKGKITFWKQLNSIWNSYWKINTQTNVKSLSLSPSNTKLISCLENRVVVVELQANYEWLITQTIQINQWGYRLNFINNEKFVFHSQKGSGFLQIFSYVHEKKQFIEQQQIQVQRCMTCGLGITSQFIELKNILIVRHDCQYNIFQIDQKNNFMLQQNIQYNHLYQTVGTLTNDGTYLAIWGMGQFAIEIRRLQFLE